jgi:hypothetical protein
VIHTRCATTWSLQCFAGVLYCRLSTDSCCMRVSLAVGLSLTRVAELYCRLFGDAELAKFGKLFSCASPSSSNISNSMWAFRTHVRYSKGKWCCPTPSNVCEALFFPRAASDLWARPDNKRDSYPRAPSSVNEWRCCQGDGAVHQQLLLLPIDLPQRNHPPGWRAQ